MKLIHLARGRRGVRRLCVSSAVLIAAALALLAPSSPAAAQPPGGRCVGSYYAVENNYGLVHEQVGPVDAYQNASSVPLTWTESRQVTQTATTTVTVTNGVNVTIPLGTVTEAVQQSTAIAVTETMTINKTESFTVQVPPGVTAFAAWGVFKLHTSGTYVTVTVDCDTGDTISETYVPIDVYSVTSNQPTEGWEFWTS